MSRRCFAAAPTHATCTREEPNEANTYDLGEPANTYDLGAPKEANAYDLGEPTAPIGEGFYDQGHPDADKYAVIGQQIFSIFCPSMCPHHTHTHTTTI